MLNESSTGFGGLLLGNPLWMEVLRKCSTPALGEGVLPCVDAVNVRTS